VYLIQIIYKVGKTCVIARRKTGGVSRATKQSHAIQGEEQSSRLPHCVRNDNVVNQQSGLGKQIRYLRVFPLKIPAEIEHNTGKEINDQREADSKK
jgi:hypothetical protein